MVEVTSPHFEVAYYVSNMGDCQPKYRMREYINIINEMDHDFGSEPWRDELRNIIARAKEQQIELDAETGIDSILLVYIENRYSLGGKKGAAAEIMHELCSLADQNNLMIHLHVAGGSKGLVRYYERFDFEMEHNCAEDPHEDEEYVSGKGVSGTIQRVGDVKVIGRVNWTEEQISNERASAMRRVGTVM